MPISYNELVSCLGRNFVEVNGFDFYKFIFPDCECEGEFNSDFSKPNAVYLYYDNVVGKIRRRIMLLDTWEQDYLSYVSDNEGALCGGLSYHGRANRIAAAQQINALIIDLDGVGLNELFNLFARFNAPRDNSYACPMPTYLVVSGTGLHVYYVFEEPIDLFPNIKLQMKNLKYALTSKLWSYKDTSLVEKRQYQSINQSFRMVGSTNAKYGIALKAFRTGDRVSIDDLNICVDEKARVDLEKRFKPSKMTRDQAKEVYPEWYQRVVLEGNKRQKKWNISGQKGHNGDELYLWWLNRASEVTGGHRYFFLMCLAIYACKCDIPKKRLKLDMQRAFEELSKIGHTNPLTQEDIDCAFEAYSKEYYNFTISDIEKLSDLRIIKNKRNGRKQSVHLKGARAIQAINDEANGTNWRDSNGRPKGSGTKQEQVLNWRREHPKGRKIDCERETGLSRHTVLKWWDCF